MEQTFSIIKPDGVKRNLIGKILSYFEDNGLKIVAIKICHVSEEQIRKLYIEHTEKAFFPEVLEFMKSAPVCMQILEGENSVLKNRSIMGDTDPKAAPKGTIRGDLASSIEANLVHGAATLADAQREISIFFPEWKNR
ncbi:nucleoside-diphosphate kinase [Candidatus Sneabacter namystus]